MHLIDKIARRSGEEDEGARIHAEESRRRYGRIGPDKRWIFDIIRVDLVSRGIIRCTRWADKDRNQSRMYKLTAEWRDRPRRQYPTPIERETPRRPDTRETPPWARYCVEIATFDLAGMLREIMTFAGVSADKALELSAALNFNAIADEIERVAGSAAAVAATEHMAQVWRWRIDGQCKIGRDPNGERLHTPVTNLGGVWRAHLGFRGVDGLVCIDARNSQMPLVASRAVADLGNAADESTRDFVSVCAAGGFYEETYRECNGRPFADEGEREAWKSQIMKDWFYCSATHQARTAAGRVLAKRWPQIHAWLLAYKRAHGVTALPCAMQKWEASLWIDQLVPALAARSIPVLTVHDSVLVPADREAEVMELIKSIYATAEIRADFKPERLSTEHTPKRARLLRKALGYNERKDCRPLARDSGRFERRDD
ncbi:hypothetical protein [Nannocystis pusilla]|uniref:hypothetical protein n=1 Tax=Nannocystis pusilla TaxID=889268 RepID=UPI003DA3AED4